MEPHAMIHVSVLVHKAKRARPGLLMHLLVNVMIVMIMKFVQ